jgi:hypothetical protein
MAQEARQVHAWFWWGSLTERDNLEELRVEGKIILKYLFKKHNGGWTGLIYSGQRQVAGCCESGNESSGPLKHGELDYLSNC